MLLSYEDCEGCTNHAANDSNLSPAKVKRIEFCMIAGPPNKWLCNTPSPQFAHQVAVRVKNTDRRHRRTGHALLAPCLAQQSRRRENGRLGGMLVAEDGWNSHIVALRSDGANDAR